MITTYGAKSARVASLTLRFFFNSVASREVKLNLYSACNKLVKKKLR